MKIGDRFFTIAYTSNNRVIEVEIIGVKTIDGIKYIHIENTSHVIDKWFLPIKDIIKWRFTTREEANKILRDLEEVK